MSTDALRTSSGRIAGIADWVAAVNPACMENRGFRHYAEPVTPGQTPAPGFALTIHADYQCRHSGACCTAGWDIPIEPEALEHLRVQAAAGQLDPSTNGTVPPPGVRWFEADPALTGAAAILRHDATGACVFFDRRGGNLCAIQRDCGHRWLPVTCQQFPRLTLIAARGVHVSLSHYCPTAAALLFRDDVGPMAIVTNPDGAIRLDAWIGFDATGTIPPLIRPGIVADIEVAAAWESFAVHALAHDSRSPEAGVARLSRAAEQVRVWKAGGESLAVHVTRALAAETASDHDPAVLMTAADAARLFDEAVASVPEGLPRPSRPAAFESTDASLVAPAWPGLAGPIRRYLSAKAFAAWSAYQGEGLRTQVVMIAVALGVLRVEAIRQAAAAGRALDAPLLLEAIRQSDLLMVHLSSGADLVRRLGRIEHLPADRQLAAFGLRPT